jgi:4-amino-4-deoxy-L-arabinose transferase-like glycosyltransferase
LAGGGFWRYFAVRPASGALPYPNHDIDTPVTSQASAREVERPATVSAAATRPAWSLIGIMTATVVVAHVLVALITPYGFHRDEFLYMAMGRNLRLFAMDFPPMIALLAEAQRAVLGDAPWSVRLAPALAHGGLVLLTGLLAWRLGGGRLAQVLAMTAVSTGPVFLRAGTLFQPVVFDQLWWSLALYALVCLAATEGEAAHAPRYWLLFGLACGIGLLTKFSILLFGAGVLAALLISRRAWLRTRGPWLAAGLALTIGSPSWIGQIQLGFPVVNQMGDLREAQLARIGYGEFLLELVLMHGPATFLLAAIGGAALLGLRGSQRWRVVGLCCAIAFLIIMALRGKPYYVAPVFPTLFAAGAVVVGRLIARMGAPAPRYAAFLATLTLVGLWGLALLPLSLPIYTPGETARFAAATGRTPTTNRGVAIELPQDFADMLGWENKVRRVADVYHGLPTDDRDDAVIIASNYGQAGAIDFYGPHLGLPRARAPIGSYWFWGPGDKPGRVIIKVGGSDADLQGYCNTITLADRVDEPWVVPEERDLAIWVCRAPPATLQEVWPQFRGQN